MQPQQPSVTVDFDVPATMRDGTVLRANVYRPAGEGRWPVLLTRLPYGKDAPRGDTVVDPVQAARRGYVVIVQDTRGSGASDGDWYPFRSEADDGDDTVAWAAGLPFADGQVGMYGLSYFGFTQHAAAVRQPPALKGGGPLHDLGRPPQRVRLPGRRLRARALGELALPRYAPRRALPPPRRGSDGAGPGDRGVGGRGRRARPSGYVSLPLAEFAPLRRQDAAPAFFDAVAAPMDRGREPVASGTLAGRLDRIQAPAFYVGGWYDIFLGDTLAGFAALRAQGTPAKLLIGPWSHRAYGNPVGEVNFGTGAAGRLHELADGRAVAAAAVVRPLAEGDRHRDAGGAAGPASSSWAPTSGATRTEWPLARAVATPWYLRADGGLSPEPPATEEPDRYDYDPADPVPTRGGATMLTPEYPAGPVDQRPT